MQINSLETMAKRWSHRFDNAAAGHSFYAYWLSVPT